MTQYIPNIDITAMKLTDLPVPETNGKTYNICLVTISSTIT
jgi:hypothetical protein